jgi:hypothetical protein
MKMKLISCRNGDGGGLPSRSVTSSQLEADVDVDDGVGEEGAQQQQDGQQEQQRPLPGRSHSNDLSCISGSTIDTYDTIGIDNLSICSLLTSNSARFDASPRHHTKTVEVEAAAAARSNTNSNGESYLPSPVQLNSGRRHHRPSLHGLVPPQRHVSYKKGVKSREVDDADDDFDSDHGTSSSKRESITISTLMMIHQQEAAAAATRTNTEQGRGQYVAGNDSSYQILQLHHKAPRTGQRNSQNESSQSDTGESLMFDDSLDPLMAAMQISTSRRDSTFGMIAAAEIAASVASSEPTTSVTPRVPVRRRSLPSAGPPNTKYAQGYFEPSLPTFSEGNFCDDDGDDGDIFQNNDHQTDEGIASPKSPQKQGKMLKSKRHHSDVINKSRLVRDDSMTYIRNKFDLSSITMDSGLLVCDNDSVSNIAQYDRHECFETCDHRPPISQGEPLAGIENQRFSTSTPEAHPRNDFVEKDDYYEIGEEDMTQRYRHQGPTPLSSFSSKSSPLISSSRSISSSTVEPPKTSESRFLSLPLQKQSSLHAPKRRESNKIQTLVGPIGDMARFEPSTRDLSRHGSLSSTGPSDTDDKWNKRVIEAPPKLPQRQASILDKSYLGHDRRIGPSHDEQSIVGLSCEPPILSRVHMPSKDLSSSTLPTQALTATSSRTLSTLNSIDD